MTSMDLGHPAAFIPPIPDADTVHVHDILAKGRELEGIGIDEALALLDVTDRDLVDEIFATARFVKDEIYGNRVVLFAPLYLSNLCRNDCVYCGFRISNRDVTRKALSMRELKNETEALIDEGHKRLLLVSGEAYPERRGLQYVFDAIDAIYSVSTPRGNIRRVNVNLAPLTLEEFRELKTHHIGTYQLFQETYHEPAYRRVHPRGPKSDFHERRAAIGRAFEAGIDDVGIGVLFGLHDWRFEVAALLTHIRELEARYGVGPHTISVPRLHRDPLSPVSDEDFRKIIAVLRIAVPYTGLILSTRETPEMRRDALQHGVSQISAGSRTNPGGYSAAESSAQFELGDHRSLHEVIEDVVRLGFLPSFCTGCYRAGRVGKDFMDLAKPGLIRLHCLPNAIFSFAEYLHDFASPELRAAGFAAIEAAHAPRIEAKLDAIAGGARDVYV